jgi:hypothetical protein
MAYTEDELMRAGTQLAQAINHLNERIGALEGAPAKQRMEQDWQDGQDYLRSKHYSPQRISNMEDWMVQNGVASHAHAARLRGGLGSRIDVFGSLEKDERDLLEQRRDDEFLDLAISRTLAGERGR